MIHIQLKRNQPINTSQLKFSSGIQHSNKPQLTQSEPFQLIDNPSHRVFVNNNLLSFKGKNESALHSVINNIQQTRGDKRAKQVLVNLIKEMDRTITFVDEHNSPASDIELFGYGLNAEGKAFAQEVSEKYYDKTGYNFYPSIFMPNALENIISEVGYEVDRFSEKQFDELKNNYDNYQRKEYLKTFTIQLLNHNKELPEFKPFIKDIERIVDDFENRINQLGLGLETRTIVANIKRDLGVKLDMPDLPHIARFIDQELRAYKHPEVNFDLPERITLNTFSNFATEEEKTTIACFYYPCEQTIQNDLMREYSKINGYLDTTKIDFNPFILHQSLDDNNEFKQGNLVEFSDNLRHELGHFWHFKHIGLEKYLEKGRFALILDEKEQKMVLQFMKMAEKLEPDWPAAEDLNLSSLVEYYDTVHNIEDKKRQFDPQFLVELKPVIQKIDRIVEAYHIIHEEFPLDCREHAETSIEEMIAFAVQFNPRKQYSEKSEAFFAKYGMPEMKDRCLIADREKYLSLQQEKIAPAKKRLFSGIRKFFS